MTQFATYKRGTNQHRVRVPTLYTDKPQPRRLMTKTSILDLRGSVVDASRGRPYPHFSMAAGAAPAGTLLLRRRAPQ
jgi:hypothetical protein